MSTLAELRSELLDELKIDPNMKVNSPSLLNRNINRAIAKVQQDVSYSLPDNVVTLVFSATTQETNLPADFIRVANPNGVKLGDSTPLFAVDYVQLIGNFNLQTNVGQPYQYYIRKTSASQYVIGLFPSPLTNYQITFPYYKRLPKLVSDSDESPLPDSYNEAITVYATYVTLRRIKGYEGQASNYRTIYEDILKGIQSSEQIPDQYSLKVGHQRLTDDMYLSPKALGDGYQSYR